MKVSITWLNEWIAVDDLDVQDLADRLTMAGLEVDSLDVVGEGHDDIVVGKITAIEEHPKADRLVVCQVDAGQGEELTIVCGAKNMGVGDRVPVALPGAKPPGIDFGIGAREVMGVKSFGMLCSEEELDLAQESEGLMILEPSLALGEPIFEALDLVDQILEIDLTPNRADCLSYLGIAREVAALYGRELREQRLALDEIAVEAGGGDAIPIRLEDEEGCPHYRAAILEGITNGDSPVWLQRRLRSVGMRTVNFAVDVTNFVLMDVGQPLHAFDLDKLRGGEICVRRAAEGETIVGIDHGEYTLTADDLVIADGERPVAIAGVMGGAETEVDEGTTRILLECAYFDPTTVRRSAKRHGLHTESSHRFERGIDPGAVKWSLNRALNLFVEGHNEVQGDPLRVTAIAVAGGFEDGPRTIDLSADRVNQILGLHLDAEQCSTLLTSIGIKVVQDGDEMTCRVPSSRGDLTRPIDLVEEVARLHGYDAIPATLPPMMGGGIHRLRESDGEETIVSRDERGRLRWARQFLLAQGLLEAVNYSFIGDDDLDRLRLESDDLRRRAARVANPLVQAQARMRTTMVPALVDNLKANFAKSRRDVALFEVGRRFFESGEVRTLALAATGSRQRHWQGDQRWDFYDLKGLVNGLCSPWAVDDARWSVPETPEPFLHPGVQAVWTCKGQQLGWVGQLHPAIAQQEKIDQPILLAEIDLEALTGAGPRQARSSAPVKFPSVVRDFALLYDERRPYSELEDAVEELASAQGIFGAIFESLQLFDVYEGEQVPQGRRSLAIKVTYRSAERTLTDEEIDGADRQLLSHLAGKVDAQLRG